MVAPGGVGTLLELLYTWQLLQVKQIANMPIILLGSMWEGLVEWIRTEPLKMKLLDKEDLELLYVTRNCDEAFTVIQKAFQAFQEGDPNFCKSYKRYSL